MPLFPMALPAGPVPRHRQEQTIVISPWIEILVSQYRAGVLAPPRHRWPRRLVIVAALLATTYIALSPAVLLRRIRAAYPSEPAKQRALELCGRVDPTFLRFFANERAACYARFHDVIVPTNADLR